MHREEETWGKGMKNGLKDEIQVEIPKERLIYGSSILATAGQVFSPNKSHLSVRPLSLYITS